MSAMNKVAHATEGHALSPLLNFFSGLLLRISGPFRKGDLIEINGQLGSVEKKGLQKTIITHLDGSSTAIANGQFFTKELHNLSTKNIIRLNFSISLSYDADMGKAKEIITEYLEQNEKVLPTPAPKLQVCKLKEKSVELSIQSWCLLDHFMELDHQLEERLKMHLVSLGFELEMDELAYENFGVTA